MCPRDAAEAGALDVGDEDADPGSGLGGGVEGDGEERKNMGSP